MFIEIFISVLCLIFITAIGFFIGKKFKLSSKDISTLLVYVISPFVIFDVIIESPANIYYLGYSLGAFICASIAATICYMLGRLLWSGDGRANLFGFAGGTGNTGYFALPLVMALFGAHETAVAIFIIIGINLYEFSVGYFITAKGVLTIKQSLQKISKLPILYSAAIALLIKTSGFSFSPIILSTLANFKGAYSVLGMMIIGITLSSFKQFEIDWKFMCLSILWKHLLYPVLALFILIITTHLSSGELSVIALMLATPMAGNVVVIANNLNVHPEKAALSVMISTLLALISVPCSVTFITYFFS